MRGNGWIRHLHLKLPKEESILNIPGIPYDSMDNDLEDTLMDAVDTRLKTEPDRDRFFQSFTTHLKRGWFEFFESINFPSCK